MLFARLIYEEYQRMSVRSALDGAPDYSAFAQAFASIAMPAICSASCLIFRRRCLFCCYAAQHTSFVTRHDATPSSIYRRFTISTPAFEYAAIVRTAINVT